MHPDIGRTLITIMEIINLKEDGKISFVEFKCIFENKEEFILNYFPKFKKIYEHNFVGVKENMIQFHIELIKLRKLLNTYQPKFDLQFNNLLCLKDPKLGKRFEKLFHHISKGNFTENNEKFWIQLFRDDSQSIYFPHKIIKFQNIVEEKMKELQQNKDIVNKVYRTEYSLQLNAKLIDHKYDDDSEKAKFLIENLLKLKTIIRFQKEKGTNIEAIDEKKQKKYISDALTYEQELNALDITNEIKTRLYEDIRENLLATFNVCEFVEDERKKSVSNLSPIYSLDKESHVSKYSSQKKK